MAERESTGERSAYKTGYLAGLKDATPSSYKEGMLIEQKRAFDEGYWLGLRTRGSKKHYELHGKEAGMIYCKANSLNYWGSS